MLVQTVLVIGIGENKQQCNSVKSSGIFPIFLPKVFILFLNVEGALVFKNALKK